MRKAFIILTGGLISFVVLCLGAVLALRTKSFPPNAFLAMQQLDVVLRVALFPLSAACSGAFVGYATRSKVNVPTILAMLPLIIFFAISQILGARLLSALLLSVLYFVIGLAISNLVARWRRGAAEAVRR